MSRRNYLVFAVFAICVLLSLFHHFSISSDYRSPEAGFRNSRNRREAESRNDLETLLDMTRSMIKFEMRDYNFSQSGVNRLEDLVPESGGTPIRSVIVSAWRSGSSFFGDLLDAVPATFYSHEPLAVLSRIHLIRGPPFEARANHLIKNIFRCNQDSDIEDYYAYAKQYPKEIGIMNRNRRLWKNCNFKPDLCFNAEVGTKFCKQFPFQAMKLTRFRLPQLRTVMEDKELNVKVVLLIRDPRGVLQSRLNFKDFCSPFRNSNYSGLYEPVPDCADPAVLCSDMVKDYEAAVDYLQRYPGRFMAIRFEDLALELEASARAVLRLLGLQYAPAVAEFIRTHSNNASDLMYFSTLRVSQHVPFKWKKLLTFDQVAEIQDKCSEAMSLWGYELARDAAHMADDGFYPLSPYSIN